MRSLGEKYINQKSSKRAQAHVATENDQPSGSHDESPINCIDAKEDVILQFQDESRAHFSSKVLSVASKAFATMFTARYLVGQSLDSEKSPTIMFPDDDPRAFQNLCLLLYHEEDNLDLGSRNVFEEQR